jgi:hypothetical protein
MKEIPTPESEAAYWQINESNNEFSRRIYAKMQDLERRLTVAREALIVVANHSSSTRLLRISREALTTTAPKQ